jgi:putative transposase
VAYIDLNMVREGIVSHPAQWIHGGYSEIQASPPCHGVIDVGALRDLFGFGGVAELEAAQRGWVEESLKSEGRAQTPDRTAAIALGSPQTLSGKWRLISASRLALETPTLRERSTYCVSPKRPSATKWLAKVVVRAPTTAISPVKREGDQGAARSLSGLGGR